MRFVAGKPLERWMMIIDCHIASWRSSIIRKRSSPSCSIAPGISQDGVVYELLQPLIGDGIFAQPGGASVKETRRIFARSLATIPDERVRSVTEAIANEYFDRWLANPKKPVAITEEFSRLTVDVVSECTLGGRFTAAESIRFTRLFFAFHKKAFPLLLMLVRREPAARARAVREMGLHRIGAEMRELMRARFVTPLVSGRQSLDEAPFAKALADAGRFLPGPEGEEALLDEISVMLLAGHETTASTLSWLAYELTRHSDIQEATAGLVGGVSTSGRLLARRLDRRGGRSAGEGSAAALSADRLLSARGRGGCDGSQGAFSARQLLLIAPWTLHRHGENLAKRRRIHAGAVASRHTGAGPYQLPAVRHGCACMPRHAFRQCRDGRDLCVLLGRARPITFWRYPRPLGNLTTRPDREIMIRIAHRDLVCFRGVTPWILAV